MWDTFGFEFVNFYLIPGLVLGCIYALGAIGITLTFSILRFANFAHGEYDDRCLLHLDCNDFIKV